MVSVVVNGIMSEGPGAESVPDTKPQPELVIGLLAAPGPASELTESLVGEIADRLPPATTPPSPGVGGAPPPAVSATTMVPVFSSPALGPLSVRKRTPDTIVRLVGNILGDLAQAEGAAGRL